MKELLQKLKKDQKNDTSHIRRVIAYGIDWYLGGVVASLPIIMMYMSQNEDVGLVPQDLSIFEFPYNITAGLLSFAVAVFFYVFIPCFVFKGQTLGKKICKLKIIQNDFAECTTKQLFIRQFVMILILEGSVYSASNMLHQVLTIATGINISKIYSYIGIVITLTSIICLLGLKSKRALHDLLANTRVVSMQSNDYLTYQKKVAKASKKLKPSY